MKAFLKDPRTDSRKLSTVRWRNSIRGEIQYGEEAGVLRGDESQVARRTRFATKGVVAGFTGRQIQRNI
jgi:hypothetical protein